MSSASDEYMRNLERWAASELPVFRVADWEGTWSLGVSGGLGSVGSDGTHRFWGLSTQGVCHRRPGERAEAVTVTSNRPDIDEYIPELGNMAIQLRRAQVRDDATASEANRLTHEWDKRLRSGEFAWMSATFSVDGVPTEFEVLAVGEVWFAFAHINDDVTIEMLGLHTPFADLRLTRSHGTLSRVAPRSGTSTSGMAQFTRGDNARVDRIEFRVVETRYEDGPDDSLGFTETAVEVLVNGVPLGLLWKEAGGKETTPLWLSDAMFGGRPLWGERDATVVAPWGERDEAPIEYGRMAVLTCGCGFFPCGGATARIEYASDVVTWSDFHEALHASVALGRSASPATSMKPRW